MFQPLNSLKLQVSAEAVFILYKDKYDLIERYQQGLFQKLRHDFEEYFAIIDSEYILNVLGLKLTSFSYSIGKWNENQTFKTQVSNDASQS